MATRETVHVTVPAEIERVADVDKSIAMDIFAVTTTLRRTRHIVDGWSIDSSDENHYTIKFKMLPSFERLTLRDMATIEAVSPPRIADVFAEPSRTDESLIVGVNMVKTGRPTREVLERIVRVQYTNK